MLLFLVDDSRPGFWSGIAPDFWAAWKLVPLAGREGAKTGSFVDYFVQQIQTHATGEGLYYVITDLEFKDSAYGGIHLLNSLCPDPSFVRGCVYSTKGGGTLAFADQSKCVRLESTSCDREETEAELRCALDFLLHKAALDDPRPIISQFTRAIHALHNLPVRLDAQTIRSLIDRPGSQADNSLLYAEIWKDSFARAPGSEASVLEERIREIFDGDGLTAVETPEGVIEAVRNVCDHVSRGIDLADPAMWSDPELPRRCRDAIAALVIKIDQMTESLRAARKASTSPA